MSSSQHIHLDTLPLFDRVKTQESSSPGESHPQALTESDVTVSRHPALIVQPFNEEVSSGQATQAVV